MFPDPLPPSPLKCDLRQVPENTEAQWERSDFFAFSCCYDSLKDFYDIYEVAALKWKVSACVTPERERADGSMGECSQQALGSSSCPAGRPSSGLGIVQRHQAAQPPALPAHTRCSVLLKSIESDTPLVTM